MTKDKEGNFVFRKGETYRITQFVNPVWLVDHRATCLETRPETYGKEDGTVMEIPDRQGLFTVGDDTRWWFASSQFEKA
jgi:hypothetical protein